MIIELNRVAEQIDTLTEELKCKLFRLNTDMIRLMAEHTQDEVNRFWVYKKQLCYRDDLAINIGHELQEAGYRLTKTKDGLFALVLGILFYVVEGKKCLEPLKAVKNWQWFIPDDDKKWVWFDPIP